MDKNYTFKKVILDVNDNSLNVLLTNKGNGKLDLSRHKIDTIPYELLKDSSGITEIILPEGLKEIEFGAFQNSKNLENINIPSSVEKIAGKFAINTPVESSNNISGCFVKDGWCLSIPGSGSVTIPEDAKKLSNNLLEYDRKVTSIHISSKTEILPRGCFYYAYGLKKITFDKDSPLKEIDWGAIYGGGLEEMHIPSKVEDISYEAIYSSNLKKIFIDDLKNYCNINRASNSIYVSSYDLYLNNNLITNLIIPSDIEIIKPYIFKGANITSVTIPKSIKNLGTYSFGYTKKLENIVYESTISEWNAITKEYNWAYNAATKYVQCTDGQVTI